MGAEIHWVPIFAWVLIQGTQYCVADMGAYIHGVPILYSILSHNVYVYTLVTLETLVAFSSHHILQKTWIFHEGYC